MDLCRDNGLYWGLIGIMEKNMEATCYRYRKNRVSFVNSNPDLSDTTALHASHCFPSTRQSGKKSLAGPTGMQLRGFVEVLLEDI